MPLQVRGRPRGLQAARRDRRALLCPQPRSWRHATNLAARARECAQAIPAPRRRPQSIVTDAPAHWRRHPAGGRGGRIWRYFRSAHAHRGHAGGTGGLAKRPDGFRRRIPHLGVRAGKSHLINGLLRLVVGVTTVNIGQIRVQLHGAVNQIVRAASTQGLFVGRKPHLAMRQRFVHSSNSRPYCVPPPSAAVQEAATSVMKPLSSFGPSQPRSTGAQRSMIACNSRMASSSK